MIEKLTLKQYFTNLKGRDKRYLTTVFRALKDEGLVIYLGGGSVYSKEYNDIDILTSGMVSSLGKAIANLMKEDNLTKMDVDDKVAHSYVGSVITGKRYNLEFDKGKTKIDISFSYNPFSLPLWAEVPYIRVN